MAVPTNRGMSAKATATNEPKSIANMATIATRAKSPALTNPACIPMRPSHVVNGFPVALGATESTA